MFFKSHQRQKDDESHGREMFYVAFDQAKKAFPELFKKPAPATDERLRQKRFEAISLTMSVVLWHLKNTRQTNTAQAAHDAMFQSFDRSLREGGVGDIGVGHKIKNFAQAFYGRLDRYTKALDAHSNTALAAGLQKNMGLPQHDAEAYAQNILTWAQEMAQNHTPNITKIRWTRTNHAQDCWYQ